MSDGLLSLNWNNHGATFCHTLAALRGKDKYTDVTVSCGGHFYQVHKLVLSTCSEYFEKIFENTPCKHPVIVLRDVQCDELESLLNYMYKGVVSVAQSDLSRLIKVAELLQIKGLAVPDEPPPSSRHSFNKRTSDDRLSPRSNNDSSSPYPKRRRRRDSDSYQVSGAAPQHRSEDPLDTAWSEDPNSRRKEDKGRESAAQERIPSPVTVNVDEPLVKEEILDDDQGENDLSESDYCGFGDASGDGSQDAGGLTIPKFDEQAVDPSGSLSEPVVEALAGPSGLQGWADGGDMARRLAMGEGFVGNESQDMSSSVGLPSQASGQPPPRQMVEVAKNIKEAPRSSGSSTLLGRRHRCSFCDYSTDNTGNLVKHIRIHTKEKPFKCPLCPLTFTQNMNLKRHIRTHTGEKPYCCSYCPYRANQSTSLRGHIFSHHRDKYQ